MGTSSSGKENTIKFLVKDPVMLIQLKDTENKILTNKFPTKLGLSDDSSSDDDLD